MMNAGANTYNASCGRVRSKKLNVKSIGWYDARYSRAASKLAWVRSSRISSATDNPA